VEDEAFAASWSARATVLVMTAVPAKDFSGAGMAAVTPAGRVGGSSGVMVSIPHPVKSPIARTEQILQERMIFSQMKDLAASSIPAAAETWLC
jgi:hypothetical protein